MKASGYIVPKTAQKSMSREKFEQLSIINLD